MILRLIIPFGTLVVVACGSGDEAGDTAFENTGGVGSGGALATGGKAGAVPGSGGSATGGSATGGSATGGSATGGSATGGSATGGSATGGSATGGSSSVQFPSEAPFSCELGQDESPCNLLISAEAPYPHEFALLGCGVSAQSLRFDDFTGSRATLSLQFAEPLGTGAPGSYALNAVEPALGSVEAWTSPGTNCTAEILCHQYNPSSVFETRYVLVGRVVCTEPFQPVQGTSKPLNFRSVWFRSFVVP